MSASGTDDPRIAKARRDFERMREEWSRTKEMLDRRARGEPDPEPAAPARAPAPPPPPAAPDPFQLREPRAPVSPPAPPAGAAPSPAPASAPAARPPASAPVQGAQTPPPIGERTAQVVSTLRSNPASAAPAAIAVLAALVIGLLVWRNSADRGDAASEAAVSGPTAAVEVEPGAGGGESELGVAPSDAARADTPVDVAAAAPPPQRANDAPPSPPASAPDTTPRAAGPEIAAAETADAAPDAGADTATDGLGAPLSPASPSDVAADDEAAAAVVVADPAPEDAAVAGPIEPAEPVEPVEPVEQDVAAIEAEASADAPTEAVDAAAVPDENAPPADAPSPAAADGPSEAAAEVDVASGDGRDDVRTAQELLAAMGYAPGPADGALNAATRDAAARFLTDRGFDAPTGGLVTVDVAFLETLRKADEEGHKSSASAPSPGPADEPVDQAILVRDAQLSLASLGYAPGPPDGQAGRSTRAAARAFAVAAGLESSAIDAAFVRAARTAIADGHQAGELYDPVVPRVARVREIQRLLGDMGYDVGRPDGAAGPRTQSAINAFAQARGVDPEAATPDLLEAVRAAAEDGHRAP